MSDLRIDIVLIIYIIICVLMILFNTAFLIYLRYKDYIFRNKRKRLENIIKSQINRISKNEVIDPKIQEFLFKKLISIRYLKSFHEIIKNESKKNETDTFRYLKKCKPIFEYLLVEFSTKENAKKAYLAFLISEFKLCDNLHYDFIVSSMISYTMNKSIYVRQNALNALYMSNNSEAILSAIMRMQELKISHSNKLISDGLLLFNGDRAELASLLWKEFDKFDLNVRIAIVNFIKTASLDYAEEFYQRLTNKYTHKEVKLSLIRYFGKMIYQPAGDYLITMMKQDTPEWEYKAIAATALAKYKSQQVIDVLKEALKSDNWYIRFNASESLVAQNIGYMELIDIYNGTDRYAREILEYKMETSRLKKQAKEGE